MKQKQKTRKALSKRFKITGTGKFLFSPTKRRHLLTGKPARKMLRVRKTEVLGKAETKRVRGLLVT